MTLPAEPIEEVSPHDVAEALASAAGIRGPLRYWYRQDAAVFNVEVGQDCLASLQDCSELDMVALLPRFVATHPERIENASRNTDTPAGEDVYNLTLNVSGSNFPSDELTPGSLDLVFSRGSRDETVSVGGFPVLHLTPVPFASRV